MKTHIFTEHDLASRTKARGLRSLLFQDLEAAGIVELDFKNVRSISDSFADELFGILAARHGVENLASKVKIENASRQLLLVIASNIQNRTQNVTH